MRNPLEKSSASSGASGSGVTRDGGRGAERDPRRGGGWGWGGEGSEACSVVLRSSHYVDADEGNADPVRKVADSLTVRCLHCFTYRRPPCHGRWPPSRHVTPLTVDTDGNPSERNDAGRRPDAGRVVGPGRARIR